MLSAGASPGRTISAKYQAYVIRKLPVTSAHFAATCINTSASFAIAQLSDINALGRWALGSMDFIATGHPDVWRGQSLFDGSDCFVEIHAHPELGLIDYLVGSIQSRALRVSIRVISGDTFKAGSPSCIAAMTTWRADGLDEEGWTRSCRAHDVEVLLFKAQIEACWNASR